MVSPRFVPLAAAFVASGVGLWTGLAQGGVAVFVFVLSGWLVSLCLHEFGHAYAAWRGGDASVAAKGYLTLDPLAYTHPALSLLLPAIFVAMGGIGLPGGAVYVDHSRLRSRAWESYVSLAGPAMTLAFLIACAAPFRFGPADLGGAPDFWSGLAFLAYLQATALLFNLLPLPGFDGFGAIAYFLSRQTQHKLEQLAQPIMLIIFLAIFMAPALFSPFFDAVRMLLAALGVDLRLAAAGWGAFRFWR
ncbi:MAG: site-2 protease family protein [Methylobacteriaceae bacterium]|nr:site-2 protease family protein [Methylobacteriaceae bacterium]